MKLSPFEYLMVQCGLSHWSQVQLPSQKLTWLQGNLPAGVRCHA